MDWWIDIAQATAVFLVVAIVALFVVWLGVKIAGKKVAWLQPFYEDIRPRLRLLVITLAVLLGVASADLPEELWWVIALRTLSILAILATGFLIQEVVNYSVSRFIARFEDGDQDDAEIRRITTQLRLMRRLANAIIALLTIGIALFTFPQVQAVGAGLLASAGIISVIGGLAAQAVLGNLFAGIQLAFSNAIRVGDVVVVEGEWGTIGEITLSYVVVYIWDERRLIVPSTYFTQNPFETWTRKSPKVYGVVAMDLDWSVPVPAVRDEFHRYLDTQPLWDKRLASCQVVDSTGGVIRVRFVASAADSSAQWNLRCEIREHMVEWVRENYPEALPRTRVDINQSPNTPARGRSASGEKRSTNP